jgi:hypothetical protein
MATIPEMVLLAQSIPDSATRRDSMDSDLQARLGRIERRSRLVTALVVLLIGGIVFVGVRRTLVAQTQSLRVSEIVVVDSNGVERIRIAGRLPDPVVNGRPVPRGGQLAGILLYDEAGVERSGYGTFSPEANVVLTLDGKQGQRALFVATPEGDTALKMWRGNDWVEFRVDEGGARLNAVQDRQLANQVPNPRPAEIAATCAEYKALRSQVAGPQLIAACRERMSNADCTMCLR